MTTKMQATKPAAKAAAPQQAAAAPAAESAAKKAVLEKVAAADAVMKTEPPADEPDQKEEEQEAVEPATGTSADDLPASDAQVVAEIGTLHQQATHEMKTGNLNYVGSRHQIGGKLETNFGDKERQQRGQEVIKAVARKYKISTSELYRCWKFYKAQPDFDRFVADHPDLSSWTLVKAWLPDEGSEEQRKRKRDRALVEGIKGGLKKLREGLAAGLKANVAEADLLDLAKELKETTEQVLSLATSDKLSDEPAE